MRGSSGCTKYLIDAIWMSVGRTDGHCLDPLGGGGACKRSSSMGLKVQYIQVQVGIPRYLPW